VKTPSADGSVGSPHVRVGHRQASIFETPVAFRRQGFLFASSLSAFLIVIVPLTVPL
jgi:hypothetical protein